MLEELGLSPAADRPRDHGEVRDRELRLFAEAHGGVHAASASPSPSTTWAPGYSGLEKIAHLNPHYLKFDRELIRDIDSSYIRREMTRALKAFADKIGSTIIAEGIEREGELKALLDLGIEFGQGFLLARPTATCPRSSRVRDVPGLAARARPPRSRIARKDAVVRRCSAIR